MYWFYSCVSDCNVYRVRTFAKTNKQYEKFIKLLELNDIKYEVKEI